MTFVEQIRSLSPVAVVLDLDGTLLSNEKEITDASKHALYLLRTHQIGIIIASARPWFEILPYWNDLGSDFPVICMDGAVVYHPEKNLLLYAPEILTIPEIDTVHKIVDDMAYVFLETATGIWAPDAKAAILIALAFKIPRQIIHIGFPAGDVILRLYLASRRTNIALDSGLERKIADELGQRFSIFRAGTHWLSVNSGSACKSKALMWLCAKYGLSPRRIIAFGDGKNDLGLFSQVGLSVAPCNAHEDVKKHASFVAKYANGDGVNEVVSEWLATICSSDLSADKID